MSVLASFFGGGNIVEQVGDALDSVFTSDEEKLFAELEISKAKQNFEIESRKLGIKEEEIYLVDTQSARDMNSKVQESEHASWMAKNIMPVMALVTAALTFFLFYMVVFAKIDASKENMIMFILGALTTILTQIYSYFFGSSKGSNDKQLLISAYTKQKGNQ